MTLVYGNIRFIRIFAEVPWRGASNDSGVVDNGNFQGGLFIDKASIITYYHLVPRRLSADPKMRDLE